MAKQHELRIDAMIEMESGGNVVGYYSKGHHDPQAFLDAYRSCDPVVPQWVDFTVEARDVVQTWARWIPYGESHGLIWHYAKPNSRGAFPVTEINYGMADINRMSAMLDAQEVG